MWHDSGLWKQDQKSGNLVAPCICLIHPCFKVDIRAVPSSWNSLATAITQSLHHIV